MTHSRVPIDVYRFLIAYYGGERHAPFVDFLAEHYEGRFASVGAFDRLSAKVVADPAAARRATRCDRRDRARRRESLWDRRHR